MIIEGSFYRLTPVNDSSLRFDLELLYDIGGKNPRKEFKTEGYGYTLETALKKCCSYAINRKFGKDEVITLKRQRRKLNLNSVAQVKLIVRKLNNLCKYLNREYSINYGGMLLCSLCHCETT